MTQIRAAGPLSGLAELAQDDPGVAGWLSAIGAASFELSAAPGVAPLAIAGLAARRRPVLAVTSTGREAEDLAGVLAALLGDERVALFPSWETLPHERLSPRSDTVGRRLAVLRRLAHPSGDDPATGPLDVVVAPVRAILQPHVPSLGDLEPVALRRGDTAELDDLVRRLVGAGYARVDLVERRGELAVRGGILDVFPPTEEHPLRVELWGDEVEEIRYFKVVDQRSLEIAEHGLWAPPCRELLLTDPVRERAAALLGRHPELAELLEPISRGEAVEGMESLAPVLVDQLRLVLHELPAGCHVVLGDPQRVAARARELAATSEEFLAASWAAAAGGGVSPIDLGAASLRSLADAQEQARELGLPWWTIT
ncbi:MAG: transcription-repair coupling factor, partial [Frankiaceae bacterium]|nr:transcription-repair coupling factor [Frankiaceae bacterium]